MKGFPGRVNGGRDHVFHQKDADRIGVSRLRESLSVVAALHSLHHCFLHDRLDVGGREELALDARRFGDPEAGIGGKKILPGEGKCALKELLIGRGMERADFQEDALAGPEKDIGPGDRFFVAQESHTAVTDVRDLVSDVIDLFF